MPSQIMLGLIATLVLSRSLLAADAELVDRVVAIVNSRPVLFSEVKSKESAAEAMVLVSEFPAEKSASDFNKSLEDLINQKLVASFAKQAGIKVGDKDVEGHIHGIISNNPGLTLEGFTGFLAQQGKSMDLYKKDLRMQMLWAAVVQRDIMSNVEVSQRQLQELYTARFRKPTETVALEYQQVLFPFSDQDESGRSQLLQKAEALRKSAAKGGAFLSAGKEPSVRKQGIADFAPMIRNHVESLKKGSISPVIDTPIGYLVVRVKGRQAVPAPEFVAKTPELRQEILTKEKARAMQRWLLRQRSKAQIKKLL